MNKTAGLAPQLLADALESVRAGDRDTAIKLLVRAHAVDARHVGVRNALGVLRLENGDATGALALLKPLARELPSAGPIQLNYGNALVAAGRAADAVAPLKRAASLDAQNAVVWYGLGRALQTAGRVSQAEDAYRRCLALQPSHVNARANLVAVLNFLDRYAEAEAEAEAVLAIAPHDAGAHFNRGVALLSQGRWAEGWAEYEWRRRTTMLDGQRRTWATPEWTGDDPTGRTVLVYAEQGYGDTLQFVRWVRILRSRGARVILQCPESLVSLFRASQVADEVIAFGVSLPPHDVQVPLTSLGYRLGLHDLASVVGNGEPYLQVPSELASMPVPWADAPGPRIGLVWQGSPTHVNDMHRSCGFAALAPLLSAPGITWVSLQVPEAGAPFVNPPKRITWYDYGSHLASFAHTAAVLRALDGVVTIDSSTAHLAGALGTRCWLLLPRIGMDWRWAAETESCRWYRSVTAMRQERPSEWRAVLSAVGAAIAGPP